MHAGTVYFVTMLVFTLGLGAAWLRWVDVPGWREDVAEIVAVGWWIAAVTALISGLVVGYSAINTRSCETVGDGLERDHRYSWVAGCLIETDQGRWVPDESYRVTNEETG